MFEEQVEDATTSLVHSDDLYLNSSTVYTSQQEKKGKKYKPFFFFTLALLLIVSAFLILSVYDYFGSNNPKQFLTILQFNDIYEISSVAGLGGFPRLKTFRNQLIKDNNHVITVLAGDFFSPSAMGLAPVKIEEDKPAQPLHGRQMVDCMNHLGSKPEDFLVTFGNHEYDISETSFYSRLDESQFTYVATNVEPAQGRSFPKTIVPYFFRKIDGVTVAFISLSIYVPSINYIKQYSFDDSVTLIQNTIASFEKENKPYDILVAITHQSLAEDSSLAFYVPQIDLIMGGHEHENWRLNRGSKTHPLTIAKADSNAKTVFIHQFKWHGDKLESYKNDPKSKYTPFGTAYQVEGLLTIESTLTPIDNSINEDSAMAKVTKKWTELAYDAFRQKGLDPGKYMSYLPYAINAQDANIRFQVSPMGQIITDANLAYSATQYDVPVSDSHYPSMLSVLNMGSVRIDDILPPGDLYVYDCLRILPFGGTLEITEMSGKILRGLLNKATQLFSDGMYLGYSSQYINCPSSPRIPTKNCAWTVDGELLKDNLTYTVVLPSYCITPAGWPAWFESLEDVKVIKNIPRDAQLILVDYMTETFPPSF